MRRTRKKPVRLHLRLPELEQCKTAVLNTLISAESRRSYKHAIGEFIEWYCSEPRLALNRVVVLRYRQFLESSALAPSTINVRLAAVRRVAYRFGTTHDHKLELLDTGKKNYSELVDQIKAVTHADPEQLGIMRIDLCADVPGIPVLWFQPRVRVKYKRFAEEIGQLKYEKIGRAGVETLTAGKRPNLIRIYDKVSESKVQFRKILRKCSRDSEPPVFEKEFGFSENSVITRVERQFGGSRIPDVLASFAKLPRAPEYNPFNSIEITNGTGCDVPNIEECGFTEWLIGTRLNELRHEMGMQQFRPFLNRYSQGNAARMLEKYGRFFANADSDHLDTQRIFHIYRDSVSRQLAA